MSTLARIRSWFDLSAGTGADAGLTRHVRNGFSVIGLGAFGLVIWTLIAPLHGAVIAPGFVKVDMNRKVVQHQEGGIVKDILVREGERVRAGQPLVVLEDVRVDASVEQLRLQLDAERAKNSRLQAESVFAPVLNFPPDLAAREKGPSPDPKLLETTQRERGLFRARREALDSQVAVLRKQIEEMSKQITGLGEQIKAEEKAYKLQDEELKANVELQKQGFIANVRVLGLQRAVAEYEARLGEHRSELSKAHQQVSELQLRILTMRNAYMQSATDELKDSTSRVFDLQERLRPSLDAAARQKIVAPVAGEVVSMKVFTPGAVIGPRDVLMEIVPLQKDLVIEVRLQTDDINYVKPGIEADVRLTAYKRRTTPLVVGKVTYVAADRVADPANPANAYYPVYISVTGEALKEAGDLRLLAGMPAEVYIRTDERTPLDYMLAPWTDYFRRGMREPL